MKNLIKLSKSIYSEQVVRKSLYWFSEHCLWHLEDDHESWHVIFANDHINNKEVEKYKRIFHRLLNDFILREELDHTTKHFRVKIISAVLEKLSTDGK